MDWQVWHDEYDRPDSPLARRLRVVQSALDGCPPGPLKVISLCAGQGRDLHALSTHRFRPSRILRRPAGVASADAVFPARSTVPFLLDTGGHEVCLDRALARKLGLATFGSTQGRCAGGKTAPIL